MCTTKKFVKCISTQMMPKCEDSVSQPIKREIFNVVPIAFPLLMWCFQLIHSSTLYTLSQATDKSQEAGAPLNMFNVLHLSYNAQKLFCIYSSWKVWCAFFGWDLSPRSFQLFASTQRFEMIENRSCLTRQRCIRVGIEPNGTTGQLV